MNLDSLKDRVKALQPALLAVEIGASFAAAIEQAKAFPSAWVVPIREGAAPNNLGTQRTRQKITETVAIIWAVRGVTGAGVQASMDLSALRKPVRNGLVGWKPEDMDSQLLFAGGAIVTIQNAVLWWQDNFTTDSYVTN